jgi:hypothetical protein
MEGNMSESFTFIDFELEEAQPIHPSSVFMVILEKNLVIVVFNNKTFETFPAHFSNLRTAAGLYKAINGSLELPFNIN